MRIILKIFATSLWLVLWVLAPVSLFVFITARVALFFLTGLAVIISILLFIQRIIPGGILFAVIAFLISPLGIPAIAQWLIEKLYQLKYALGDFITN